MSISPESSQGLKELSRRHQATLFMTLLAAFDVVLHAETGQSRFVVGTDVANLRLSLRRANAVKQYLATHGIAGEKIKTTGRGKTSPMADNKTTQGRARNRRVEVEIRGTRTL